ncbi:MAG: phosphatase PAP2 family protein [Candidatus Aminicenantes bacterium]|nr:phosphatase PAP2 family protein [Candidatus Aminicenantes bacterium]
MRKRGKRIPLSLLARTGDSWIWFLGTGLVWLVGNPEWKSRAARLLLGLVLTAGAVFVIKILVKRRRPDGDWGGVYRKIDPYSFPSGHAARAVAVAVIAWSWAGWPAGALLLVWALAMSLARVALRVHFPSDAVGGALVGAAAGFLTLWVS